jgi:putative membrane protein
MMWGDGWGWIGGGLMMLVFWGGLIAVVVFLVRGTRSRDSDERPRPSDPRDILRERFARGEISEKEYEERTQVLERHS